jgi:hypothetical protein
MRGDLTRFNTTIGLSGIIRWKHESNSSLMWNFLGVCTRSESIGGKCRCRPNWRRMVQRKNLMPMRQYGLSRSEADPTPHGRILCFRTTTQRTTVPVGVPHAVALPFEASDPACNVHDACSTDRFSKQNVIVE